MFLDASDTVHSSTPLLTLNIIGAGRLAQTLAKAWHRAGVVSIQSVCNRSCNSAKIAVQFIGAGEACASIAALPPADITLVAVPDQTFSEVIGQLGKSIITAAQPSTSPIIFHCSGIASSDVFTSLQSPGAISPPVLSASIHPRYSFADPANSMSHLRGVACAYEGDAEALQVLIPLFESLGMQCSRIDKTKKILYHAACVMMNNGSVGLANTVNDLFTEAGMSDAEGRQAVCALMQSALDNIQHQESFATALTGPVSRNDTETLAQHRHAISAHRPARRSTRLLALYDALIHACQKLL